MISFHVSSIEHKYGHLRDVLNEYLGVIIDIQDHFDKTYEDLVKRQEEQKRFESLGIRLDNLGQPTSKIVS